MTSNWDDDWENIEIKDLIVNLQDTIKNKERELKMLEERKLMEEADLALVENLFNEKKISVKDLKPVKFVKKEKMKELNNVQQKKNHEQQEQSQKKKAKKQEQKRMKEIYGEAELDEYDEMYGDIEDKYC